MTPTCAAAPAIGAIANDVQHRRYAGVVASGAQHRHCAVTTTASWKGARGFRVSFFRNGCFCHSDLEKF
ncbi:hypothetical protein B296_00007834 [Ensete ventricosum]|uniref:Uncharacterized protein n=1 Tax=Ensete ventricosum TaxID=4639 RepID=A0A426YG21_ENSVE|nr:hypothetical protein B296_00007834 [Ensete ventricosum]